MLQPLNKEQREFIEKYKSKADLDGLELECVGYILDRDGYDPFPYSQDMQLINKIIQWKKMKFLNKEQIHWMNKVIEIYDTQLATSSLTDKRIKKLKSILKREMYDSQPDSEDMLIINSTKSWYKFMKQLQKIH